MAQHDDKRQYRKIKRDVKRAGTHRRRQYLKRDLLKNPEEAGHAEFDYGDTSSASMNGNDQDATRKRGENEAE